MGVNDFRPHVFVVPEDDANRQIATGFQLGVDVPRQIQILEVAGGWLNVLSRFDKDHVPVMSRSPLGSVVLLIDFDDELKRLQDTKLSVPEHLQERVFILGSLNEPEDLKRCGLGAYESIGLALAKDCREGTSNIWSHQQLRHNEGELNRLRQAVRGILFTE